MSKDKPDVGRRRLLKGALGAVAQVVAPGALPLSPIVVATSAAAAPLAAAGAVAAETSFLTSMIVAHAMLMEGLDRANRDFHSLDIGNVSIPEKILKQPPTQPGWTRTNTEGGGVYYEANVRGYENIRELYTFLGQNIEGQYRLSCDVYNVIESYYVERIGGIIHVLGMADKDFDFLIENSRRNDPAFPEVTRASLTRQFDQLINEMIDLMGVEHSFYGRYAGVLGRSHAGYNEGFDAVLAYELESIIRGPFDDLKEDSFIKILDRLEDQRVDVFEAYILSLSAEQKKELWIDIIPLMRTDEFFSELAGAFSLEMPGVHKAFYPVRTGHRAWALTDRPIDFFERVRLTQEIFMPHFKAVKAMAEQAHQNIPPHCAKEKVPYFSNAPSVAGAGGNIARAVVAGVLKPEFEESAAGASAPEQAAPLQITHDPVPDVFEDGMIAKVPEKETVRKDPPPEPMPA